MGTRGVVAGVASAARLLQGVRRPWICSATRQLVALVCDASGSMHGTKATEATAAVAGLVADLALPVNRDAFDVAVVHFSGDAELVQDVAKAKDVASGIAAIEPGSLGGGTNITAGLEMALDALDRPSGMGPSGRMRLRPVVVVFTDGCHNEGLPPHEVAARIRARADLVCVAFGDDADEALLRELATSPQHAYRCRDGRDLRGFMAAVGRTLTATMSRRANATGALALLPAAAQTEDR